MSKNNSVNGSNAKKASVHSHPAHPVMASLQEAGLLDGILDSWLAESLATGKSLDSSGFLGDMLKAALERGLLAELSSHVGYEKGDPSGSNGGNLRNGFYEKTLESSAGPVRVHVLKGSPRIF